MYAVEGGWHWLTVHLPQQAAAGDVNMLDLELDGISRRICASGCSRKKVPAGPVRKCWCRSGTGTCSRSTARGMCGLPAAVGLDLFGLAK
jgi:hypothetical protein